MFPFKQKFPTPKEHTPGVNSCQYVILHHTGTKEWTIKGVLDWLYRRDDYASCHFVIDTNWDAYKIGLPQDILWHAWQSSWGKLKDMNKYSMGIEVIGPLSNWGFTSEEKLTLRKLVQHLMFAFNIPKENVIRHKDIAPTRKVDPYDTLFDTFTWFSKWQSSLKPKEAK